MKKLKLLLLTTIISIFALAGCDDAPKQNQQAYVQPQPVSMAQTQPSCGRYYDDYENGYVTQCYDPGNRQCFTLYKPSGRQAYYCNGTKMWQTERQANWNGAWGFAAGMALSEVIRPKYINRNTKPSGIRPSTYKRPTYKKSTSNASRAAAAAKQQQKDANQKAQFVNGSTKVDKTGKSKAEQFTSGSTTVEKGAQSTADKQKAQFANTSQTVNNKGVVAGKQAQTKVDLTKKKVETKVDLTKKKATTKVNLTKKKAKPKKKVVIKKKKAKKKKSR